MHFQVRYNIKVGLNVIGIREWVFIDLFGYLGYLGNNRTKQSIFSVVGLLCCVMVIFSVVLCWNGMWCYVVLIVKRYVGMGCWVILECPYVMLFYIFVILADGFIQSDISVIQ